MARTVQEWVAVKPIVSRLYITHSLKKVMDIMAQEHNFHAT